MSHVTTAKTHTMTKQEIYGRDDIAIHDAELLENNIRICLTHFNTYVTALLLKLTSQLHTPDLYCIYLHPSGRS